MIHYNTKNISALKMSYILEEMGIKNNKFMLRLNNPELLHIDPFDENLTELEKAMVTNEIIINPWYFFREIVRIPSSGQVVSFEFHRGTIALIWTVLNNICSFSVWPRQVYKTTTMYCIYNYLYYWGSIFNKMTFIAHEDSIARKNLQGVKDIRNNLPIYLNLYDSKKDKDNEKEMYNRSNNNRINCRGPARNPDASRKAGRGLTTPILWFDEVSFITYIADMYDSISFAYSKASESAKESGAPYHQVMTTTAGFLNTEEGKWAYKFLNSSADFTELFYDMDIKVVRNVIKNTSLSDFVNLSYMYYDLGKDENYLEEQKKRLVNSPTPKDTLDREVLNVWKEVITDHPLSSDKIERLYGLRKKPTDYVIINDTYSIRMYVDMDTFDFDKPLIGGLDIGGNLKGDFSALVVLDPSDFSVIAVLRSNSQSTLLFSFAIVTIMKDLFKGLILFPERNYNAAVIDTIAASLPNSRKRIYYEREDAAGIFNSKKVRPILFNMILRLAVDDYGDRIYDNTIITEIGGIIREKSGKLNHKSGKNDDTMIAYLLALYFILYVDDVGKYIDKSIILSKYEKNNLIGYNKASIPLTRKSENMKKILENSFLNENVSGNVNSIDDIGELMLKHHISNSPVNMDASVELFTGEDDNFNTIEESFDIGEVRETLKQKKKEGAEDLHLNDNQASPNTHDNDFKTVFSNYYKDETNSDFSGKFGW